MERSSKHPLEENSSWELHLQNQHRRQLKKHHHEHEHHVHQDDDDTDDGDEKHQDHHKHDDVKDSQPDVQGKKKKHKKHVPKAHPGYFHGLMIDAGSQGTRIHLYEFERRILYSSKEVQQAVNGYKLSLPTTNSRWTNRLHPGLDVYSDVQGEEELQEALKEYLGPLLDFAKTVLAGNPGGWHEVPIYLKATGGLRTLPTPDRIRLINGVRQVFHDKTFNPFSFEDERARVISGEEEAIYGWVAVNFLKGALVKNSEGTGTVLNPKKTVGMLEMGGASTQIGFFENNGDVMANLFKVQIGGARHWNVYAHSFLYFGINGAWSRLNALLVAKQNSVNPCLPTGSNYTFHSWIHAEPSGRMLPRSDPRSTRYGAKLHNDKPNFDECSRLTRDLLRKSANEEWVEFSHDGDCSFAGVYQPPLPTNQSNVDAFIATSNYFHIWEFLQLPSRSPVRAVGEGAKRICAMSLKELTAYNAKLPDPVHQEDLVKYCFRATFAFEILHAGYGFSLDYEIIAADIIDGQKTGWALGSILYEINTLPWDFGGHLKMKTSSHVSESLLGLPNPNASSVSSQMFSGSGMVATSVVLVFAATLWSYLRIQRRRTYQEL